MAPVFFRIRWFYPKKRKTILDWNTSILHYVKRVMIGWFLRLFLRNQSANSKHPP